MLNGYYKILEIHPTKDVSTVKLAYKKLAARYHPDKNLQNQQWAEEKFKLVSEAYRLILEQIDSLTSPEFDAASIYKPESYKAYESKIPNYWDTIRNSKDPVDQIKIILHELEKQNRRQGLKLYDQLAVEMAGIDPLSLLNSDTYFDACLLLAEAMELDQRYGQAVDYYAIYYQHNRIILHKRLFANEIKEKIIQLYKLKICKNQNTMVAINGYLRLLGQITFSNKEKAKLLKDLVKLYIKEKQNAVALRTIEQIKTLDPKTKGLEKLILKINESDSK